MVRIRSLAKELHHLEEQRQSPSPAAQAEPEDNPVRSTSAKTSPAPARSSVARESLARASASNSSAVQTDHSTSASPSEIQDPEKAADGRSATPQTAIEATKASTALSARPSSSSSSSSAHSAERPHARHHSHVDSADRLFSLGGSRFDILVHGSFGDGAACRKSEVRKATKVCSSGKAAIQRSAEEVALGDAAEGNLSSNGNAAGTGTGTSPPSSAEQQQSPSPPPPPLGTSCGIPTRPPFKRLLAQPFSHVLVCDFEATCAGGSIHFPHEIIEFPVVVLDTATLRIVAEFHRYVRPLRNPKLTSFCTELTGITQEVVDGADPLPVVVAQFQAWLETEVYPLCKAWAAHYGSEKLAHNLKSEQRRFVYDERTEERKKNVPFEAMLCMATDGPWDMRRFMHECSVLRDGVEFPPLCYRYINVRHSYSDHFKCRQVKLTHMLKRMSMSFEGRRHSGIDDTRNITRVLAELMARGYRVHHASTIKYAHRGDKFLESNQIAQELLSEFGETDETHTRRLGGGGTQGLNKRSGQRK